MLQYRKTTERDASDWHDPKCPNFLGIIQASNSCRNFCYKIMEINTFQEYNILPTYNDFTINIYL